MQYVPSIRPATTSPATSLVTRLTAVHAVKPVHLLEPGLVQQGEPEGSQSTDQNSRRQLPFEEHRKACRRINHQTVLLELRSGVDRRHHDLFGAGVVEHVDEKA